MYVIIACSHCGGQSQIDDKVLGMMVLCPLCQQSTLAQASQQALPVALPLAQPQVGAHANMPEVLSLDDAPTPSKPDLLSPQRTATTVQARRSPLRTMLPIVFSFAGTVAIMIGIYFGFRYGHSPIPSDAWKDFVSAEGQCTILLPGEPHKESMDITGHGIRGGTLFTVRRWFEKLTLQFGWVELDPYSLDTISIEQWMELLLNY